MALLVARMPVREKVVQFAQSLVDHEQEAMSFQIMPMDRMPHAGLAGPVTLLETPAYERLVYLEVQRASFLVEDPDEVRDDHHKYGMLRSQALSPNEGVGYLHELLGDR